MSIKRRDKKHRILKIGESQRKDGSYRYKYVGVDGKEHNVYSWRLVSTDVLPPGKRDCEPLRDKIRKITADLNDKINPQDGSTTVLKLCEKYILLRNGVRENTRANYKTVINTLKKHPFGSKRIDSVTSMDARYFLTQLQKENKKSYSTIHNIVGVLRPAFKLAIESNYIRKNPFDFMIKEVLVNNSVTRKAISRAEERKLLDFIKNDNHFKVYYDAIFILFKTGMRISEFCGLTISDINLKDKTINIDHQLQRRRDGVLYVLDSCSVSAHTKTSSGKRLIPMITDDVYTAFKHILNNRPTLKEEIEVDGYKGFIIMNERASKGIRPMVAMDWEHIFSRIIKKYNDIYRVQMPKVTPHVCRHTFCNNMANSGMNPVILQHYMGHSDITVTMKHYVHTNVEDAKAEVKRLLVEGKLDCA